MTRPAQKRWPEPEAPGTTQSSTQNVVVIGDATSSTDASTDASPAKPHRVAGASFWVMIAFTVVCGGAVLVLGAKPEPPLASAASAASAAPQEAPPSVAPPPVAVLPVPSASPSASAPAPVASPPQPQPQPQSSPKEPKRRPAARPPRRPPPPPAKAAAAPVATSNGHAATLDALIAAPHQP